LQISPVKRQIGLPILYQTALCIVNRITAKNEQLLDVPVVYVRGELRDVYGARILRNLPDYQCLAEIFQRSVDRVNKQLYRKRLIGTS
jgi:hypothetical protein